MRNAAMILGLIAGLIGIFVGMFGFGYAEFSDAQPEIAEAIGLFENPGFIRFASFIAPLLAIAGGAIARDRGLIGGVLLLAAAGFFYFGVRLQCRDNVPYRLRRPGRSFGHRR